MIERTESEFHHDVGERRFVRELLSEQQVLLTLLQLHRLTWIDRVLRVDVRLREQVELFLAIEAVRRKLLVYDAWHDRPVFSAEP